MSEARAVAARVVQRVFEQRAYADRAFCSAAGRLDARDRAFAQQLVYGTVQRVRTLDHGIEMLGRRPVRKLDPPVRAALRTGAYQLAFMDAVPPHAAVHETVELVRAAGLERAVAFTKAVMRRLAEGLPGRLGGLDDEHRPRRRSCTPTRTGSRKRGGGSSVPKAHGPSSAPRTSRPRRPCGLRTGRWWWSRFRPEWLESGHAWPQSRGSQLAGAAVGAHPGERILDLCAAPDGKATQLAAAGAEVVAVEKHPGRPASWTRTPVGWAPS
jgi:16S rRNA (cytosine967-C5)-methyltransferase